MIRLCAIVFAALASALVGARGVAAADSLTLPPGDVRIIVNSQPGGTVDTTTRLLAEELKRKWNRGVIIENVVGGGGNLGAARVAQAAPDGLTLLVSHPGPLTVNPLLFPSMPYDPAKFVPITVLLSVPNVLVVKKALGIESVPEFLKYAKANPGKLSYASQGIGSTTHLAAALLSKRAGIDIVHVPYRGSPQAIMDLRAGVIDMMFDNLGTALPQHEAGMSRIIGVADMTRAPALPGVPTLDEAGLKNFRAIAWFGMMAPEGAPEKVVNAIYTDVAAVVRSDDYKERVRAYSATPMGLSPKEAATFIDEERTLWSGVIQEAGIAAK